MKKIKKRSDCPISSALDIVGDKWSLLIIRDIAMSGKNTYNEFLRSDEKIATNILADRLSMLLDADLLATEEHPESKAKIFYRLTTKGTDLLPVLFEIILWSDKYLPIATNAKEFAKMLRTNKEGLINQMSNALKK
jgi:DNA-binding HxlR family transcriptional regulator